MNLPNYFIEKPVLSLCICFFIFFAGIVSLMQLPIRLIPKMEIPVIDVETEYAGASPDTVQHSLTTILQNALIDLKGVDYIQSSSQLGKSHIHLHFKLGYSSQLMMNEVANKIHSVKKELPLMSEESVITTESGDDKASFIIAFTSPSFSRQRLSEYVRQKIKPIFECIPDVASSDVMGEDVAMRIWLDLHHLEENQLTPLDVATTFKNQNLSAGLGVKKTGDTEFNLDANSMLSSAQQFNQIVLKSFGNSVLRLQDVGWAGLGAGSQDITTVVNGMPATMIFVKLLSNANPLTTAKKIHTSLSEIQKQLPDTIQVTLVYDASRYIYLALWDLIKTLFVTLAIIVFVIYSFLGNARAIWMPVVSIPLSLIGVGCILWLTGCSLNTLTLLAMVIAIGLVVDDTIIVLENIYRHLENGIPLYEACVQGIHEIVSPVISMSLILTVVYLPIVFLQGFTQKIFSEFALTLAASVLISCVVSIILIPMMCSHFLPHYFITQAWTDRLNRAIQFFNTIYESILSYITQNRPVMCFISVGLCVISGWLYDSIPRELIPREDQGLLQVIGNAPVSTTSDYLKKNTRQLNSIYQKNPDIERYVYVNNIPEEHQFLSFITLKPLSQRKHSITELHKYLQQQLDELTGLQAIVIEPSLLPINGEMPIEFVLKSDMGYRQLFQISDALKQRAIQSGKFIYIDQDIHFDRPQYDLHIDRNSAAEMGVSMSDITENISLLLSENTLQSFSMQGETYPIILHVSNDEEPINQLQLKNKEGTLIPIDTFVDIHQSIQADALNQFQKMNAVTLQALMRPGYTLSEGLNFLNKQLKELTSQQNVLVDYSGESRAFFHEMQQSYILFLAAIFLMYLILAILFENFIFPLIILLSCLPGTFFSVLLALYATHTTLNLYTEMGMLTLIGLVCKHGILIIQFAEQLRKQKHFSPFTAVLTAARLRLRPILMTSAAMLFAAVPLIVMKGVGAISHVELGIVIASGILFGTFFTLLLIPFFYCLFIENKNEEKVRHVTYE